MTMPRLASTAHVGTDTVPGRALLATLELIHQEMPDHRGCGHASPYRVICAQHPPAGALCGPCADRHSRSHNPVDEHRCDGCGDPATPIHPVLLPVNADLFVGSLGWCDPCAAAVQGRIGGRG